MNRIAVSKKVMAILVTAVVVVIALLFALNASGEKFDPAEQLSIGQKFLSELDYDNAILCFERVIGVEPANVRAYLGMTEAYVGKGDTAAAIDALKRGYDATGDAQIKQLLDLFSGDFVWKDSAFAAMVAMALEKPLGQVTVMDLWKITSLEIWGSTNAKTNLNDDVWHISHWSEDSYGMGDNEYPKDGRIQSLIDLDKLPNLQQLTVSHQSNLDITALENSAAYPCTINLRKLSLIGDDLTSIQVVSGLTNLEELTFTYNNVSDITALAGLINLTELKMSSNKGINSTKPLSNLSKIEGINAFNVGSVDLNIIASLPNLTDLHLSCEQADYSLLPKLTKVDYLEIEITEQDLVQIAKMPAISKLRLHGYGMNLAPLSQMPTLKKLEIAWTMTDISSLASLSQVEELRLENVAENCDLTPLTKMASLKKMICDDDALAERVRAVLPRIELEQDKH